MNQVLTPAIRAKSIVAMVRRANPRVLASFAEEMIRNAIKDDRAQRDHDHREELKALLERLLAYVPPEDVHNVRNLFTELLREDKGAENKATEDKV